MNQVKKQKKGRGETVFEWIENAFDLIINYSIILLEFIGSAIIVVTAIKALINLLRGKKDGIRLELAQGIALALEFKLGSEVLRTVVVRNVQELLIAGAIVLLRAAMTFLIHWEIKNEKAEHQEVK